MSINRTTQNWPDDMTYNIDADESYDYCPHCHSEHRVTLLDKMVNFCLDCFYEEAA